MNYNRNVVVFTLVTTIILFLYSLFAASANFHLLDLEHISIVSDVLSSPADSVATVTETRQSLPATVLSGNNIPAAPQGPRSIELYDRAGRITDFSTDTSLHAALGVVMNKLYELEHTKKGKVRIAWLGDSFIEGDLLTKTVRADLQKYFGNSGVGFVPVTSVTNAGFRTTVNQKWTGDWTEENFKSDKFTAPLFLSGRCYYTANGTLNIRDLTPGKDSSIKLQKSLLCGYAPSPVTITVNGASVKLQAPKPFNRIPLDSSTSHSIEIGVQNSNLPVYGVSFEPENGVTIDNFSFRGISGEELGKLDTSFLAAMQQENPYDLVVLEYGVNVLYRPENTDFSWHKRNMTKVLQKLHKALPDVTFLVISTSDRGFRYADGPRSADGVGNLVKTQAELAYENNMSFYNMFRTMGGKGTIVRWADSTPILAGHDYVHPNNRGAEILGNLFFNSFMIDYARAGNNGGGNYSATAYQSVTDKKSGLEWFVAEDKDYTWPEAKAWAENLTAGGGRWQMPTTEQLLTLIDQADSAGAGFFHDGKNYPAHISHLFGKIGHGAWVWSSEDISAGTAYSVNMSQGVRVKSDKNMIRYPIRAFAVRKLSADTDRHPK